MKRRAENEDGPDHAGTDKGSLILVDREGFMRTINALLDHFVRTSPPLSGPQFEPWATVAEAADYAAVSEDTLREWISRGWLPNRRVGRVQRVRRSDIDSLFERGFSMLPENDQETPHPRSLEILGSITGKPDG